MNTLSVYLLLVLIFTANCVWAAKLTTGREVFVSVRDETCVMNNTHCHCAWSSPSSSQICYRPIVDKEGTCSRSSCRAGYRCECGSDSLCRKWPITYYRVTDILSDTDVSCSKDHKVVPRKVVQKKVMFHVQAFGRYTFLNLPQIVFSDNNGQYKRRLNVITTKDKLAIAAYRTDETRFGIKLRFKDMTDRGSTFDNRWLCSNDTDSDTWKDKSFDPSFAGWKPLSTVSQQGDENGFDKSIPWKWLVEANGSMAQQIVCLFSVP